MGHQARISSAQGGLSPVLVSALDDATRAAALTMRVGEVAEVWTVAAGAVESTTPKFSTHLDLRTNCSLGGLHHRKKRVARKNDFSGLPEDSSPGRCRTKSSLGPKTKRRGNQKENELFQEEHIFPGFRGPHDSSSFV